MYRGLPFRRLLVAAGLAVGFTLSLNLPVQPRAEAAGARPHFQLPFQCGQKWKAFTRSGHRPNENSIDFNGVSVGTHAATIVASAPGRVLHAGYDQWNGWWVNLSHANGWGTAYLHMNERPRVSNGQTVAMGQVLGRVGDSGDSYGSHLHYQQWADQTSRAQPTYFNGQPSGVRVGQDRILTSNNCGQNPNPKPGELSTWGTDVRIRKDSTTKSAVVATLAGPTAITVECQRRGEKVTISDGGKTYTNDAWAFLPKYGGFITNIYVDIPQSWIPNVRDCGVFPTRGTNVKIRKEPTTTSAEVATLPKPTSVKVQCQQRGEKVTEGKASNDLWSYLPEKKGYLNNLFIDHKAASLPLVPTCA